LHSIPKIIPHSADTYLLLRDYNKVIELSDVVISRGVFLDSSYGNKGERWRPCEIWIVRWNATPNHIESNNDYLLGHMGKGSVSANRGKTEKLWNVGTNFSESIKLIQTKGLT